MSIKNIIICDVYENQYCTLLDDDNHKNNSNYFIYLNNYLNNIYVYLYIAKHSCD